MPVLATLPARYGSGKNASAQNEFPGFPLETQNVECALPAHRKASRYFYRSDARLRTSLHFTMMDATNQIVVITGPTQDCGKTLVSTALAALASQAGQRVLFIDADMRQGYVHNICKLNNHCGLSSVLEGDVKWQDALQRFEQGGFDVLTCGPQPSLPVSCLWRTLPERHVADERTL
jgi:tyrosine-protein kinase Etk/Wzc